VYKSLVISQSFEMYIYTTIVLEGIPTLQGLPILLSLVSIHGHFVQFIREKTHAHKLLLYVSS